ncbi:MAG TPA: hypothetical protein VHN36_04445 [Ilumatobacteraceae bacterium]|nr:hypothetical protein [Ilumatobacteraceae bacterium]
MGRALWLAPAVVAGVVLVASAGKAAAHVETDNGCKGSGTFREKGLFVDAEQIGDQVVTIPRSDTVDWDGSVTAPPGGYSGNIAVDLPPPFSEWVVDTWSGTSQKTSNSGARKYDLPSLVPAGVEFQLRGYHNDDNGFCNGYVNLQLDGGPFDSPATPVSLVATVATGAGLFGTIRPLFRRGGTL